MPRALADVAAADRRMLTRRAGDAARLLREIANDRRLLMLCALLDGEKPMGELAAAAELGLSAASQHLARLRAAGIVSTRREATTINYALASPETAAVLETLAHLFCPPRRSRRRPS